MHFSLKKVTNAENHADFLSQDCRHPFSFSFSVYYPRIPCGPSPLRRLRGALVVSAVEPAPRLVSASCPAGHGVLKKNTFFYKTFAYFKKKL